MKKTQVVGCRIDFAIYSAFEQLCLEKQLPMSKVLQSALNDFLNANNSQITVNQL
jgi:hypothetical protein